MNCELAKEKIDQTIFEKQEPDSATKLHLKTCTSCNTYFDDSLSARNVIDSLRAQEPQLKEPELLTNNIISAISALPETRIKESSRSKTIQLVQRILAAASVTLLLVFGIEQYVIVDKLIRLQVQTSSVSESNIRQHFIQYSKAYDPAVVFETIQHELASNFNNRKQLNFRMMLAVAQFKSVELDQYDLQRYAQLKSLIQNQTQEAYD